jgi:cyclopropane fatty-acyl-phospholipid synthase-like methyltransferase
MEENMLKIMEYKWDTHHAKERLQAKYPNEEVVRFVFTKFSGKLAERNQLKILDLGCGVGANTVFLCAEGFKVYATDISEGGLKITKKRLKERGLNATVEIADMEHQPFPDNFFDGIISYGVLQYNNREGYLKSIAEMHRILKKGGKAFIYTRSNDDYTFGNGRKIEKNTFILDRRGSVNEKGMLVHYLERHEIETLFSKFTDVAFKKAETLDCSSGRKDSIWIIYVKK